MQTTYSLNGINYDIGEKNPNMFEIFVENDATEEEVQKFVKKTYGKANMSNYDNIPKPVEGKLFSKKFNFVPKDPVKFKWDIPTEESLEEFRKTDYMAVRRKKLRDKMDTSEE